MLLSLLLRGISAADVTVFDNGQPIPLDPRTKKIFEGISPLIEIAPILLIMIIPILLHFRAYYEWMEQEGNVTERTLLLNDYRDIEKTIDQFIDLSKTPHEWFSEGF